MPNQKPTAAGMKANLCRSTQGRPDLPYDRNQDCKEGIALFEQFHNYNNGKIRIDFCIHAEYTNTPDTIEAYSAACLEHGAKPCEYAGECKTLPVWDKLNLMINGYLDGITLAELA